MLPDWVSLSNRYVAGAVTGFLAAVVVDIAAFRSWKSFHDAAVYDWGTASWRWLQGTISGIVAAAGIALT